MIKHFQTKKIEQPKIVKEKNVKLAFDGEINKKIQKCNHSLIKVLENTLSGEMYHAILTLFITHRS